MTTPTEHTFLQFDHSAQPEKIYIIGDWTLAHYHLLLAKVSETETKVTDSTIIDLSQLGKLDTAGAALLIKLISEKHLNQLHLYTDQLPVERQVLLQTVSDALSNSKTTPSKQTPNPFIEFFGKIGYSVEQFYKHALTLLNFMGLTLEALFRTIIRPSSWRITSLVANIEQIGFNAVPIIILLTFMVGAVIAFLGATVLANFGATEYTVNLVVFAFLREFAVLLTAILIAGRTASAFTAQIGLMKANEEIDAIQTLGLNPIELLVLPRVLALLVSLPLLTFIGMISGIFGGMVVCAATLDISTTMFLSITQSSIEARHFFIGMVKAPIFAFLIAIIGCLEGFKVTGSAASVGARTTDSVVHSIFVVILLDAIAALYFMEMGW
ncbi:MlaE family lipid ABC transporter permease subunit [Neisseria sp. Ec49-e6-T10]|uniref:ABC transporter permease n=1 Tax=Neisseria sp. Ec49-e6-T10 TaxID=3140744 RepID=UPI003EBB43DA